MLRKLERNGEKNMKILIDTNIILELVNTHFHSGCKPKGFHPLLLILREITYDIYNPKRSACNSSAAGFIENNPTPSL